jgi:hypothetical protein
VKYKTIKIEWHSYSSGNVEEDPSYGYWTWSVAFHGDAEDTVYGSNCTPAACFTDVMKTMCVKEEN